MIRINTHANDTNKKTKISKKLKESGFIFTVFLWLTLIFFWKVWAQGLLPIPADALAGMYHPFRDYFSGRYPQGIPYKNYILTDPVLQQYPWKWLAIDDWKNGKIPWDNPYNFSGTPLLANIQAGVFYPLNILFFMGEFSQMWAIYIIVQPTLSALFMYLWLKNSKLSFAASLFGGLVWAFSSFNLVWLEWGNMGHAGLWLPLALLAVDKIKKKKDIVIPAKARFDSARRAGIYLNRFRVKHGMTVLFWYGILQFSLVNSLLAGHIQITLYLFFAVTLYWFMRLGLSKRSILLFTVYCLLFTVITSPQWYPTLKFSLVSNRSIEQADVLQREGFFISGKQLVQMIAPDFFGNPATLNYRGGWNYAEQVIYIGVIPLILALFAILFSKDCPSPKDSPFEKARKFALLLVVGGLLMAVKNPIARLPYILKVPVWSDLQPTRLSYLITFGLAMLSAMGLDSVMKGPRKFFKKLLSAIVGLGAVLGGLLIVSSKFDLTDKIVSQRNLLMPVAILVLMTGGVLSRYVIKVKNFNRFGLLFTVYCLLFTIFDLFRFGWKFTPFSAREYLYPVTTAIKFLQENMKEGDRYMTLDRRILPPNANIMYRLKTVEGYDPLYSREYAWQITMMETGDTEISPKSFGRIVRPVNYHSYIAKELGVKYMLALADIDDPNLELVFREGELQIYEKK